MHSQALTSEKRYLSIVSEIVTSKKKTKKSALE